MIVRVLPAGTSNEYAPFSSEFVKMRGSSLMPMVTRSIGSPSVPFTTPEIPAVCDFATREMSIKSRRICGFRTFRNLKDNEYTEILLLPEGNYYGSGIMYKRVIVALNKGQGP